MTRKTISALEKENRQLEEELGSFKNKYTEEKDEESTKKIHAIVDHYKALREAVHQQGRVIYEVEKRVESMSSRVEKMKLKVESNRTDELPLPELERKTYGLNKKLETVNSTFITPKSESQFHKLNFFPLGYSTIRLRCGRQL